MHCYHLLRRLFDSTNSNSTKKKKLLNLSLYNLSFKEVKEVVFTEIHLLAANRMPLLRERYRNAYNKETKVKASHRIKIHKISGSACVCVLSEGRWRIGCLFGWECHCVCDTFYPLRGSPETTCPNASLFIFARNLHVTHGERRTIDSGKR